MIIEFITFRLTLTETLQPIIGLTMEMVKSGWMVGGPMKVLALEVLSMTCFGLIMDFDLEFEM